MKLEEIKKKNIYTVPDKYFDQLPTRIQSRVNEKKPVFIKSINWSIVLKVATPALAVILLLFYFGASRTDTYQSAEQLLAQVDTEDLIAYLETTDITTEDIIEDLDFSTVELNFEDEGPIIQDIEMDAQDLDFLYDEYGIDSELL